MKYTKIIFDLDDTLVPTSTNPQWKNGDYTNLQFFLGATDMLRKIGKDKCILLTFDRYGDQRKKLEHLQVEKYFERVVVVNDKLKKREEMEKLQNEFGKILVVGDRYDEGELYHAEHLGIDTVCIAFPSGGHRQVEHHHKHLLVVEDENGYERILEVING